MDQPEAPILAGDAERERSVERLRDGCVEGRLTLAEFSERVEAALTARTQADLARLTADLVVRPQTTPSPRRTVTHRVLAVMSSTKQRGRWRAADRIQAVAVMGECKLDLRQAELEGMELEVAATVVMGNLSIIVPPGVEVEMNGWCLMGSREVDPEPSLVDKIRHALIKDGGAATRQIAPRSRGPLIRVDARVLMGEIKVEHLA